MLGSLAFALLGASVASAVNFNVNVGANNQLVYDPPFVNAAIGDTIVFVFNPKNHTVTQSSFGQPCTPLAGGSDSGFNPVQPGDTLPTWQVTVTDMNPLWFFCKQPVGNHCGHGMVFAINPPNDTFPLFQAAANATLNATATTTTTELWTSAQPWQTATATVTNGTSVWTTTYTSYEGSVPPTIAPQPVNHKIAVGANGLTFNPPNITAAIGDTVTFEFHPKNHTVTQSNFANPCQPLEQSTGRVGFDSGFNFPVSADATTFPTFTITINDTAPIWGYCGQTSHCAAGMVFSVNAVEGGPNSFENYVALAKNTGGSASAAAPAGSASATSTNSSPGLSAPHTSFISIAFLFLGALMV